MRFKLETDYRIFGDDQKIYISRNDHNLIEITGESTGLILTLLNAISKEDTFDTLFSKVQESFSNDVELFNETINWMTSNGILIDIDGYIDVERREIKTHVVDSNYTDSRAELILNRLSSPAFHFTKSGGVEDAGLLLVIAPLFDRMQEVLAVNKIAYERGIPLCHFSADSSSVFTIGPIVDSRQHTPCFNCYLKRKLINLRSPLKMQAYINYTKTHSPVKERVVNDGDYHSIALEYLKIELSKYFIRHQRLSQLLGKSITFDNTQFTTEKSKILKVPGCKVCKPSSSRTAFNI